MRSLASDQLNRDQQQVEAANRVRAFVEQLNQAMAIAAAVGVRVQLMTVDATYNYGSFRCPKVTATITRDV